MNTREDMNLALKKVVLPYLRQRGFKGSFPHFRRIKEEVDLITFQFDLHGGGFVIETATGKKEGFNTHWGKHIPAEKLRAWDLHPNERTRLQPHSGSGTDSWFRYDNREDCEVVAQCVVDLLKTVDTKNSAAS